MINQEAGLDYSYIKEIVYKLSEQQKCREVIRVKLLKSYLKFKTIELFTIAGEKCYDIVEECSTVYATEEITLHDFTK